MTWEPDYDNWPQVDIRYEWSDTDAKMVFALYKKTFQSAGDGIHHFYSYEKVAVGDREKAVAWAEHYGLKLKDGFDVPAKTT